MSHFVALAGNIGVGKTTLTNLIAEHFGYRRLLEPVVDNRFLSAYYGNMERWSFTLQMEFLLRRVEHHKQVHITNQNYIQDRTLLEDPEIFAKYLHGLGNMTDEELDLYFDYCRMLIPTIPQPDRIIYLRCDDINELLRRIAARGRQEERGITAQFLQGLAHYYATFTEVCQRKYKIPTLVLDVAEIDVRTPKGKATILSQLETFLSKDSNSGTLF